MPLQSGSNEILKLMKRGYTKEWYLNRAFKLKELCPQASISTDIIVAFPNESEKDFEETMDVIEKVRFEQIFSFKYSKRPLTAAASMSGQIEPSVASRRLTHLQSRHAEILDEIVAEKKNVEFEVLFEELRAGNAVAGRSNTNFLVQTQGSEELLGKIKRVKITNPKRMVLYGEVV